VTGAPGRGRCRAALGRNAWWACDLDSHPSGELRYLDAPLSV